MSSQHAARMEDGGFTIISHRRGRGGRKGHSVAAARRATDAAGFRYGKGGPCGGSSSSSSSSATVDPAAIDTLRRRVDQAVEELRSSPLYSGLVQRLRSGPRPIDEIVCLGVGNFASQYSARSQLALALLLRDELLLQKDVVDAAESGADQPSHESSTATASASDESGGGSNAADASSSGSGAAGATDGLLHVFDPMLEPLELQMLQREPRCAIRPRNEEGRVHLPRRRCLFLMPHCPRQLYSNVLEANWGAAHLADVLVLGNSFAALADALDPSERASTCGWCRVTRCAYLATELSCDQLGGRAGDFEYAFANTSLHTFDAAAMPPDGDEVWTRSFEPAPPASDRGLLGDF